MPQTTGSLEFRVIVTALKPRVSASEIEWLASALSECDEDLLEKQLLQEGLLPGFAAKLFGLEVPLQQSFATRLHSALDENTRRNLILTRELFTIIDEAESKGIRVVPFKGPVFAFQCHGSPGFRNCNDLDVLIQIEDLQRLKALLADRGYSQQFELSTAEEKLYLRSECEFNFTHPVSGTLVEAHWDFMPHYYTVRDLPGLWEDLVTVDIAGRAVRVMSPEHCLLALVQHGTKHSWEDMSLALDIAQWLDANPKLDFEKLFAIAGQAHMRRMLSLAFQIADEMIGVELPERVRAEFSAEPELEPLAERLVAYINRPEKYKRDLKTFAFIFNMVDSWRDRMKFVARLALTPNTVDILWVRLPALLTFLYPAFRLLRLSQIFLRQVTKRALNHPRTVNA
jgi:hypothetical protein